MERDVNRCRDAGLLELPLGPGPGQALLTPKEDQDSYEPVRDRGQG